jgi:hypothetical protein
MKHRISSAQLSDNLGEVGLEDIGDVDIVRACGMVANKHPIGMALWRLKYGSDYRELANVVLALIALMSRKGWTGDHVPGLVSAVVKHWLDDVCPTCYGRGFDVMPGSPMLSDKACDTCNGKGRLPLPVSDEPALWLLETINKMERDVAAAVMRKLSDEMRSL